MRKTSLFRELTIGSTIFLAGIGNAFALSEFGDEVNAFCQASNPFTGSCSLCHTSPPALNANGDSFLAGDLCVFCPDDPACVTPEPPPTLTPTPTPTCTDNDGDGFAVEGGDCGPVDCNDSNAAVNPNAAEACDGIDNDCDGLVDAADPDASCPVVCTDGDGDGFATEGGDCGAVDCQDGNPAINPSAVENCADGIDNNCNGLIDNADPSAVNCPLDCTDADGDGFAVEGGVCGPTDCDDGDAGTNPAEPENCSDGVDNNCNDLVDLDDPMCAVAPEPRNPRRERRERDDDRDDDRDRGDDRDDDDD